MPIALATAEFLVETRASGVSFERTLTAGRWNLSVGPSRLWPILQKHGLRPSESKAAFRRQLGWQGWSDPFFRLLGANEVDAIDASDYQGASIIHNLNEPVSARLHERFDVVFDGGTLEHIFNVPVALRSYMEMVRVGGHLILALPANNWVGHGFYQFNAEFFYSTLSEQNGYTVERMLMFNDNSAGVSRFGRGAQTPSSLMVQAERTARKPVFKTPPEQSRFVSAWGPHEAQAETPTANTVRPRLRRCIPPKVRDEVTQPVLLWLHWDEIPRLRRLLDPLARRRKHQDRSLANQRLFRRIDQGTTRELAAKGRGISMEGRRRE